MLLWVFFAIAFLGPIQSLPYKPNIIIFLVDDLGYGDTTPYGNTTLNTPNIQKLSNEGVKFTSMYSSASLCTPSRAGLLTGRYPKRTGMTGINTLNRVLASIASPGGLRHDEITVAELLREGGYMTGIIGKWHLGIGADGGYLPTHHGFDWYYGMPGTNARACDGHSVSFNGVNEDGSVSQRSFLGFLWDKNPSFFSGVLFSVVVIFCSEIFFRRRLYGTLFMVTMLLLFIGGLRIFLNFTLNHPTSCVLYRNNSLIEQPVRLQNLTRKNTREAIRFMNHAVETKKPFFLYFSFIKVHTALFTAPEFSGISQHGSYGDNVEEMDWSVGQVMAALRELGAEQNTVVFFSSDNGPFGVEGQEAGYCGAVPRADGMWVGPLRGTKGDNWECGIRVPGIINFPKAIKGGITIHETTSQLDLYPTLAEFAQQPLPTDRIIDGQSLLPLLREYGALMEEQDPSNNLKETAVQVENYRNRVLFHYCGSTITAARYKNLKIHYYTAVPDFPNSPHLGCPSTLVCDCFGEKHDPPLIFDMLIDPLEQHPIPYTEQVSSMVKVIEAAIANHKDTEVVVPSELLKLARPWLLPCCIEDENNWWDRAYHLITATCGCEREE